MLQQKTRGQIFKFLVSVRLGKNQIHRGIPRSKQLLHNCSIVPVQQVGRGGHGISAVRFASKVMQGIVKNINTPLSHSTLWNSHTAERERRLQRLLPMGSALGSPLYLRVGQQAFYLDACSATVCVCARACVRACAHTCMHNNHE